MTAQHLFAVFTNAVEGKEAEFATWYDSQHIPDMLNVPGVISARRYEASTVVGPPAAQYPPYQCLTLYDVETDDLPSVIDGLNARRGDMKMTSALDSKSFAFWIYSI